LLDASAPMQEALTIQSSRRADARGLSQALGRMKQALRLLVVLALSLVISGCDVGCSNEVVSSISSPSGTANVIVFNRGCGATTGFNTQVSIVHAGAAPVGAGNTLILNDTVPLKVQWLSESKLSISGLGSAQVFKQEQSVAGVSVAYGK